MKEFKQVRDNLLDMLEDLDANLASIQSLSNPKKTDCELSESTIQDATRSIEQAIANQDQDTTLYGICLICGKPFNKTESFNRHCHCNTTQHYDKPIE